MSKVLVSALLLLTLAACGKSEDWNEPEAPAPAAQAGQPPASKAVPRMILHMVVAGSIDAKGIPVGELYTFAPDQPQITVIARVGKVAEGSSIRFAWYQETDDEDEPLFDQTVPVVSFDRAYSEGKNPGTLAPGIYKVTATLGDSVREIEFTVAPLSQKSTPRAESDIEFHWLSAFGVALVHAQSPTSDADPGQPPVAGASGAVHDPAPMPGASPSKQSPQCDVEFMDYDRSYLLWHDWQNNGTAMAGVIIVDVFCSGPTESIPLVPATGPISEGIVAFSHNGVRVEPLRLIEGGYGFLDVKPGVSLDERREYSVDPCATAPGWDLPGEKIDVTFRTTDRRFSKLPLYSAVYTLHEDNSPPTLEVHSQPAKTTKVNAGDKIEIKITARDDDHYVYGGWETGVQKMWLTGPAGDIGKPEINPSPIPQACAKKAKKHTYTTTYTVPSNPPDVIKLCAHAQDYAGNKREKCTTFPTVDCRHATFHYDVRVAGYRRVVETWKDVHPGTVTTTADWTGGWSNVGVSVEQCALSVKILMPPGQSPDSHPANGEIRLKYDYDDALPASDPNPLLDVYGGRPPCRFHNDVRFAAVMYADADVYTGARGGMHFDFQAKPGPSAASFRSGACPAGPNGKSRDVVGVRDGEGSVDDGLKAVRGWHWSISDGILSINNQRAPVKPLPFPFAALLAGKGFSLDSDLQRAVVSGTTGPDSAQVTDRLIISFSPVGKH